MSLFNRKSVASLALSITLGLGFVGCSDDEAKVENPVSADSKTEPAAPPSADNFSAQTVYFDFDRSTIKQEAQTSLNSLGDHLRGNTTQVQVDGHCDERGTTEYNLALGERRATSVKDYLVQLGVDSNRLSTISYGEEKPAAQGHTEAEWSKNRRVEFTLTHQ